MWQGDPHQAKDINYLKQCNVELNRTSIPFKRLKLNSHRLMRVIKILYELNKGSTSLFHKLKRNVKNEVKERKKRSITSMNFNWCTQFQLNCTCARNESGV